MNWKSRDAPNLAGMFDRGLTKDGHVRSPQVERLLTLDEELMALIHCSDPRDRPRLVIQDLVGHMGRDAEPGHARHTGPTQIMKAPPGHPRKLI